MANDNREQTPNNAQLIELIKGVIQEMKKPGELEQKTLDAINKKEANRKKQVEQMKVQVRQQLQMEARVQASCMHTRREDGTSTWAWMPMIIDKIKGEMKMYGVCCRCQREVWQGDPDFEKHYIRATGII